MKIQTPSRLRIELSNKYLDLAEKFPQFGGGVIATLQRIRKRQREKAIRAYKRSRSPQSCNVEFLYFRLFEVFSIEESNHLLKQLLRLFPNLENETFGRKKTFRDAFRDQAGHISGGASWRLGCIAREQRVTFLDRLREIKELPVEIDYISVWLYKILPSIFVVTFDVYLTKDATQHLVDMQSKYYLPEIRFNKLIPRGPLAGGYSTTRPEIVMQRAIMSWIKELRGKAEKNISKFTKGYFMCFSDDKIAQLPALEVYALKGISKDKSFEDWKKDAKRWWESLGFAFYDYGTYSSEKALFNLKDPISISSQLTTYRLTVLWERYIAAVNIQAQDNDERSAIIYHTKDTLNALLPCVAIIEILDCQRDDFERLRQKVFGKMKSTRLSAIRLSNHVKLNNAILQISMSLSRISAEFNQRKGAFLYDMQTISELKHVYSYNNRETRSLMDALVNSLSFRVKLLDEHISFIKDWHSQYLGLQNIKATYILALAAVITALFSIMLALLTS